MRGNGWFLVAAAMLGLAIGAREVPGDTVTLTSGRVIEDVQTKEEGDKVRVTLPNGSSTVYPKFMISKIEKKPTRAQEEAAAVAAKAKADADAAAAKAKADADAAAAQAREYANRLKALSGGDAQARVDLAAWCLERHMDKEAADLLKEAIRIDPACRPAHEALGDIEYQGRWYADSKALIDAELTRLRDDLTGLRGLVKLCGERKWGVPPAVFRRILDLAPDDVDAHRGLGHVQVQGKWVEDPKAAREAVRKAFESRAEEFGKMDDKTAVDHPYRHGRVAMTEGKPAELSDMHFKLPDDIRADRPEDVETLIRLGYSHSSTTHYYSNGAEGGTEYTMHVYLFVYDVKTSKMTATHEFVETFGSADAANAWQDTVPGAIEWVVSLPVK